jgi:serine/threonine protein phosphatase PrpC
LVHGRDHVDLDARDVTELGDSVAIGITAGGQAKPRPPLDPNEDAGAVVRGDEAALLVVADGHFGREASELAVEHVVAAFGDDPRRPGLSDEELVRLFFDAGVAIQRETTRPGCAHPHTRTTLALALVGRGQVQWASFGDSGVLIVSEDRGTRFDRPRNVYLGDSFTVGDVSSALQRGMSDVATGSYVVVTTDGLLDALEQSETDLATTVSREAMPAAAAGEMVELLLASALRRRSRDAVTVAVART